MALALLQGHTYAIGLGGGGVGLGSELDRSMKAQGYALPPVYQQTPLALAGWSPSIFYPADQSPIRHPTEWAATVVLAGRSGPDATVQGYAGELSPLSVFTDVRWVLDVAPSPAVVRSLVADPLAPLPSSAPAPAKPSAAWWLLALLLVPGPLTIAAIYAVTRPRKLRRNPSLTEPQKRALWALRDGREWHMGSKTNEARFTVHEKAARALMRLGLVEWASSTSERVRLTPRGRVWAQAA